MKKDNSQNDAFARLQTAASHACASPHSGKSDPTEGQALAGNYKKGRIILHGLPLVIENPLRSVRSGTSESGKQWSNRLAAHYGEISGTLGADGDPVDIFVGPFPEVTTVYVINQGGIGGVFDEHKAMLGFGNEQQARDAYLHSFDRGWDGLLSSVTLTMDQFKRWLANGDMSRPLTIDQLPFDGSPMTTTTKWDAAAQPATPINHLMYAMRTEDRDNLMLDSVTLGEILADPDCEAVQGPLLDALVVKNNRLPLKMDQMLRIMNTVDSEVQATSYEISAPIRMRGVVQVCVLFVLSDGQAVAIWFHNPDTTPAKLLPTDDLISWKWMLNKKDVTIVVAPERGKDLNPREVARRVMRLASRNSAAFTKANANAAARVAEEKEIDGEIQALEGKLASIQTQIEVTRQRASDATAAALQEENSHYSNRISLALARLHGWTFAHEQVGGIGSTMKKVFADTQPAGEVGDGSTTAFAAWDDAGRYLALQVGFDDVFDMDARDKDITDFADEFNRRAEAWAQAQREAVVPAPLGDLPDGWSDSGTGMATNPDAVEGGIVDRNMVSGKWFAVFNNEQMPATEDLYDTRVEAFAAFADRLAGHKAAVLSAQWTDLQSYLYDLVKGLSSEAGAILETNEALRQEFDGLRSFIEGGFGDSTPAEVQAVADGRAAAIRQSIADAYASAQPSPVEKVNTAYEFASATDEFKERVAHSVEAVDYSPFHSAMTLDKALRGAGMSVDWRIAASSMLDAAGDVSPVLDGVAALAAPYLPEGALLDFVGDVPAAVAQLQVALDVVTTNEPINRAEGKIEQADLELSNAEQFRAAIATLTAEPVQKPEGEGAPILDAVPMGDAEGVISKDGAVVGRVGLALGDGKALIFVGAEGDERVKPADGDYTFRITDDPESQVAMVEGLVASLAQPIEPALPIEPEVPEPEIKEPELPVPVTTPVRSGTEEEQAAADAALAMAAGVVAELGGTVTADGYSGEGVAGAWSYANAEVNGKEIRLAASGGGVVQVDGKPHDPDGSVNVSADQVRASILAVAPEIEPAVPEVPATPADNDLTRLSALRKLVTKDAIKSDDPDAIPKLEAKFNFLSANGDMMRKANKLLRKDDVDGLRAMGFNEKLIEGLKTPDFANRTGFPDYELTNNNSEMRRVRLRLEELKAQAAAAEVPEEQDAAGDRRTIAGVEFEAHRRESRGVKYWVAQVVQTGVVNEDQQYSTRAKMWDDLERAAQAMGDRFASSYLPPAEPAVELQPEVITNPEEDADRAYLESLIGGTGDLLAEDTFTKLEPLFEKYGEEGVTDMSKLLIQAAEAYGNAAVAAANDALKA